MDRRMGQQQQQQSPRHHGRPSTPIGFEIEPPASPGSRQQRATTTAAAAAAAVAATLSPLLAPSRLVTARRSWSPQHQSSLEVPTPRQIQSARNSLAAMATQQSSIEVYLLSINLIRLNSSVLSSSSFSFYSSFSLVLIVTISWIQLNATQRITSKRRMKLQFWAVQASGFFKAGFDQSNRTVSAVLFTCLIINSTSQ